MIDIDAMNSFAHKVTLLRATAFNAPEVCADLY